MPPSNQLIANVNTLASISLLIIIIIILDACNSNSQESGQSVAKVAQPFQDTNVMNSSVPNYNVSQTKSQTFGDKGKPQRKRRKLPIWWMPLLTLK